MNSESGISSVLQEARIFSPSHEFAEHAHVRTEHALALLRAEADANPVAFWERQARSLVWFDEWNEALLWKHPHAQWFVGGTINASVNCLDRHLDTPRRTKPALIWEGEPGDVRTLTYEQLHEGVCRCANVLLKLGVKTGDVVAIYMGMVPEAAIAMLACARIGATHNVVFGGFSADALRERINNSGAVAVVTQDAAYRRGDLVLLKPAVDEALAECPSVKNVLVYQRTPVETPMVSGRDYWWHELMRDASPNCIPTVLSSEHPLFILYTSGSTGKPKGILHTTGGYLVQTSYTTRMVFDMRDSDIYFCTADIGWVTGHSYIVYGPLSNGATVLMYEGAPNYPQPDRFWDIIERHGVTIFYTAPTAIRAFMKWGEEHPRKHDLSSLRLLGTVGEPINPEAWMWYHNFIGNARCPIVDTWWQTETGAIMIAPLPGATPTKPGTATLPLPGVCVDVVHRDGTSCKANEGGLLVIKHPWPSMLRTVYGDDARYRHAYWSEFPQKGNDLADPSDGWYFTGDGARRDADGYIWIIGRVDDVVNVSGHRLGTAEIESALVSHPSVAEAAVVTRPDELKGNALIAFVTLKSSAYKGSLDLLKEELRLHVAKEIGHIAKPDEVRFADMLPKTRSGKIMRRLLRELVAGGLVRGDTTTLEDLGVLEQLRTAQDE
ncbi:MAG: acetate--CoA ligase [bacterium]|nr:acetate--CoA ligase [bacterium]